MRKALLGLYTYFEFFLLAVLLLPAFAAVALWHRDRDPGNRARGKMMRFFGLLTSTLTPIWRFSTKGAAPADIARRGYVVVSNHESTADPFLLCHLPFDLRFIAKEELFHQPLIGWLMRLGGDIRLRRGDGDSVRAMMAQCRRTLASGLSVLIFPEGTRSEDGNLLPFRDGAFTLAIETNSPILPLALSGTHQCRPKGSRWFGEAQATVHVLEPVETAGMTAADLPRLKSLVRDRIAAGRAGRSTAPVAPRPAATPEVLAMGDPAAPRP